MEITCNAPMKLTSWFVSQPYSKKNKTTGISSSLKRVYSGRLSLKGVKIAF